MSEAFPGDRSFSMGHPAVLADVLAVRDHARTDATTPHTLLSQRIWSALHALGLAGGRMLVRGLDPEVLAGVPPHQRALRPGRFGQLHGHIPPSGTRRGRALTEFDPGSTPGVFDVVLLNAPYADVVHHDGRFRLDRWREHNQDLLTSLAYTTPGGLVAALVSSDVLDAADPAPRRGMAVLADLLGAVRLPGGTLRNVPGCDNPVDLLLLRRRVEDQPARGARFETSVQLHLDGVPIHLNEYFHTRIGHVLGRPTVRPMPYGPARLTVEPDQVSHHLDLATDLGLDLGTSLAEIVRTATTRGLTTTTQDHARPAPDQTPHAQTPQAKTPQARRPQARASRPTRPGARSAELPEAGPDHPGPQL